MKFATETIIEAEESVRAAYRMIQASAMTPMSEVRVILLREAVGRLVNVAGQIGEHLSDCPGFTEPTEKGYIVCDLATSNVWIGKAHD